MNISVVIENFIGHMRASGYAQATIDSYGKGLVAFNQYMQNRGIENIRKVSCDTIEDYRSHVMATPLAPESKSLKLRPVKRLFEHLVHTNRLLLNPAVKLVESSRTHRKIGTVLSISQIKQLLSIPDLATPVGARNRAIMLVLYSTGIRLGELLGLHTTDIDFDNETLYVRRGKGAKQRVVPLGDDAIKSLSTYLDKARPILISDRPACKALFISTRGTAITAGTIRMFLRMYKFMAGIDVAVSPHVFRRSCATHLVQNGADIRYIQQLLGHSSLKVTHYYTKVMPVDLKNTHAATHPGIDNGPD